MTIVATDGTPVVLARGMHVAATDPGPAFSSMLVIDAYATYFRLLRQLLDAVA